MNNNKLTQAQYDIQRQQRKDLLATDLWLKSKGLNTCTLTKIPTKLLQAQNKAHTLLTQHSNLLTKEQIKTLRNFKRKVTNTQICAKLKPESANAVFKISTQIKRQLHRLNKAA